MIGKLELSSEAGTHAQDCGEGIRVMTEVQGWRKSSHSHPNGDCVEVGRVIGWRKSSFSHPNGDCVEVGHLPGHAAVRDSKCPDAGCFTTTSSQWQAFLDAVKDDRFSL
jgi:hypothetical protein